MDTIEGNKELECDRCNSIVSEKFECERCGIEIGDCCQAAYTQFSQIDYNCCKSCDSNTDYDD